MRGQKNYNSRNVVSSSAAAAAPPKKSIYELRAEMEPDIGPDGKKNWSRYNATIPGAVWVTSAPAHPAYLPGLEATQGPNARPAAYVTVSFAAPREYGPEEGWTRVRYGKSKRKQRRDRRAELIDYEE